MGTTRTGQASRGETLGGNALGGEALGRGAAGGATDAAGAVAAGRPAPVPTRRDFLAEASSASPAPDAVAQRDAFRGPPPQEEQA